MTKHTELSIAMALTRSIFDYRRWICVRNVYWGLLDWEADLIALSKSGFVHEIEIKTSKLDIVKDKGKPKHRRLLHQVPNSYCMIVNFFWYCVPDPLIHEFNPKNDRYGLIAIDDNGYCEKKIHAKKLDDAKISDLERYKLMRLGVMRYWTRNDYKQPSLGI